MSSFFINFQQQLVQSFNETAFLHLFIRLNFMSLMITLDIFEQFNSWYINPNLDLLNYN